MANQERIVKRCDKIAFMNTGTKEEPVFTRMTKFTQISTSKNAKEYTRQYVDEESETTDVTGYSEQKSYAFDQYTNNAVHEKIAIITDDELTGDDATIEVLVVDKSKASTNGGYDARLRSYAVVPDSDGDSTEAYTYSGSLKAKGAFKKVVAKIDENEKIATVVPNTENI